MLDYPIPVIGFCAYSGTGKTTLLKQLLPMLKQRGLRIGMIKHTHHDFDIDHPGKDSYELRRAGANTMLIISKHRLAMVEEFQEGRADPLLEQALAALDPARLDAVLVEGFKHANYPKVELYRPGHDKPPQFPMDNNIIAMATDAEASSLPLDEKRPLTLLDLNNHEEIIEYLLTQLNLTGTQKQAIPRQPSCADDFEPGTLTVAQARDTILQDITPLTETETLELRAALNRVLANDLIATSNIPNHTNSAVDGYALSGDELPKATNAQFHIIGTALAGKPFEGQCKQGQCVRIMTGAVMPENTDTVVMQEHVRLEDERIIIDGSHKAGQNVRQAGEDISIGDSVLKQGRRLMPADLGIIASMGIPKIDVLRRPRVAFMSTGDELKSLDSADGSPIKTGEVYDSNRYTLHGMLQRLNVETHDLGVIPDDRDAVQQAFDKASEIADVIITSGGVSVGEADYIKEVIDQNGEIQFWKIAMKPGRPLTFGKINNTLFFGLPGNPVAVMVTFYQFVKPALEMLASGSWKPPLTIPATSTSSIRKKPGRYEYIRGIYTTNQDGTLSVHKTRSQGSGILTSMSEANCFILLDEERGSVSAGDQVVIQPFEGLI